MDASVYQKRAVYGRWAVASAFFFNGFLIGSWAPQIPVFMTRLQISEFVLGLLILVFGIGALCSMPWCGYLIGRFGSRSVVLAFAALCSFSLLLVVLAPNPAIAVPALFFFGAVIGGMDVAMNANAVEVEKRLSRAVMSSSHGFWSLGGFAGGGLGGLLIEAQGYLVHAIVATLIAAAIGLLAFRHMITETKPVVHERQKLAFPSNPLIYLLGLMALFSMVPEGSVLDWAALYLQQERGADIATAGFAFAAFSGTMAVMRFLGDGVRNRFGAVRTLRASALIGAVGLFGASFASTDWIAVLAFAFSGLGIANMVPIAFSAAGNQPGTSSGVALSMVTLMGYSGILVAPSAIGFVGGKTGFGPIYMVLAGLLVIVAIMARLAATADRPVDETSQSGLAP
ncbi:MFS transporter [Phyllobacterium sp. 21LDTY02-6]|uniref:MFS transporter n=1 Tax=unclassified Phyllobacterium TaxID=2638441 RepID=UPI00201FE1F9|nr:MULTISPECIES: MFS transporter [unclassified Phyllobacterium]MCO4317531.1 MFS transporter [Phyllobacterium sp. 21LDTY02-6]MCX8293092.1 MFS transporter [Phyllobacterium sp. 0TCS1.6A]